MFEHGHSPVHVMFCRRVPAALAAVILLAAVATAQESQPTAPGLSGPTVLKILSDVTMRGEPQAEVRRITLADAQQIAQSASDPLKRLGELQVEAARQHRLGVQSMYFPSVTTQFFDLHLNETPGQLLTFQRPLVGSFISVPVSAVAQDQNAVNVVVTQPITQLFGVHQLVKIARADENIARAKAGMPVAAVTSRVEKNFFDLLVAERELAAAAADARKARAVRADALRAESTRALAAGRVAALTASLNELLGLSLDTRLELVAPEPFAENLTLEMVLAQAAPPLEVIEAEQTAVKAHSAAKLAKLEYGPGVAVLGGYVHQDVLADTVLPESFAYVGVFATYTLFDSLKRERTIKETAAQAQAADLGAQLAKAKAAGAAKAAYFELQRSREAYHLARQMLSSAQAHIRLASDSPDAESNRALSEADVFRAEIAYREAYAAVTRLMAGR